MKIKQLFTLVIAAGISATSVAETAYNVPIINNASLIYNVSGATQTDITVTASETFNVDRKVIFTLTQITTSVSPANLGTQQTVEYTLTNTSNAPIRFAPKATDLVAGEKAYSDTVTDNTAGTKITTHDVYYERSTLPDGFGSGTAETIITSSFVELLQDETVSLYVVSTPKVGEDLDIFVHNLKITAQEHKDTLVPGAVIGAEITASNEGWIKNKIQTVLDTDAGGSIRTDNGAIQVASATLGMDKGAVIISDPFSETNPIAIPGAIVKYTITVTNSGSIEATDVAIVDTLPQEFDLGQDITDGVSVFTINTTVTPIGTDPITEIVVVGNKVTFPTNLTVPAKDAGGNGELIVTLTATLK